MSLFLSALASALIVTFTSAPPGEFSGLASRLLQQPDAVVRDDSGDATTIFGIPVGEARTVLLPVSRERGLPDGFRPPDLVYAFGRPVRAIMVDDLREMRAAAAADRVELVIVSGYRSPGEQAAAFDAAVWRQLARAQGSIDRAEAEARASRFVAPPGHSQHQLGTAVDLSSPELSYSVQPAFAETEAGRWVARHGWAYGFILPYTPQAEARTGYGYEPWHARWVGRPLAALLHADGYLDHPEVVADDYLQAVEELLDREGVP